MAVRMGIFNPALPSGKNAGQQLQIVGVTLTGFFKSLKHSLHPAGDTILHGCKDGDFQSRFTFRQECRPTIANCWRYAHGIFQIPKTFATPCRGHHPRLNGSTK